MKKMYKQIVRQLKILQTLEANRFGKSARELAAKYEVDRKTIQRDMWGPTRGRVLDNRTA